AEDDTFLTLHKKVAAEVQASLLNAQPGISSAERDRAYEVLLNFVNVTFPPFDGLTPKVDWVHSGYSESPHSVHLHVTDLGATGIFDLLFDFNVSILDEPQRHCTIQRYLRVVDAFIENRTRVINSFSLQTERERQSLVIVYNNSAAPYPADKTIVDLFEAQVVRTPDDEAIRLGDQLLTYRELNARANQIAAHLRTFDVGPHQLVALHLH